LHGHEAVRAVHHRRQQIEASPWPARVPISRRGRLRRRLPGVGKSISVTLPPGVPLLLSAPLSGEAAAIRAWFIGLMGRWAQATREYMARLDAAAKATLCKQLPAIGADAGQVLVATAAGGLLALGVPPPIVAAIETVLALTGAGRAIGRQAGVEVQSLLC
jgi:hypothetical protein